VKLLHNTIYSEVILIATLLGGACASEDPADSEGGGILIPDTRENVKVVPQEEIPAISDISAPDGLSVTPSQWWTEVVVGDVLVFPASDVTPDGLILSVTQRDVSAGAIDLHTEQGYLTNVFENGTVQLQAPLTATQVVEVRYAAEGVTVIAPGIVPLTSHDQAFRGGELDVITWPFENVLLFDADDDESTTFDQIRASGSVNASVNFDMDVDLGWGKVKYLMAKAGASFEGEVEVSADANLNVSHEKVLWDGKLGSVTVWVYVIPVTITPEIQLVAKIEAATSGLSLTAAASTAASVSGVVERINGEWKFSHDESVSYAYTVPTPGDDLSAEVKISIGPRVTTKIMSLPGPYFDLLGHVRLKVAQDPLWRLFAGLTANLGIDFMIADKEWSHFEESFEIYKHEEEIASAEDVIDPELCGNGTINQTEQCDGGQLDGQTCSTLGAGDGQLGCGDNCTFDLSGCFQTGCGNDIVDPGEDCDGSVGANNCEGQGYDGGVLSCAENCTFDESDCCSSQCSPGETKCSGDTMNTCGAVGGGCYGWGPGIPCGGNGCSGDVCNIQSCGNNKQEDGEQCDGGDLDGASCESEGYDGGTLFCSVGCSYDTSSCCFDGYSILNAKSPQYTSIASGCAKGGGVVLVTSAEKINDDTIRFRVKKSDGGSWGSPATLRLYVGDGPTCGNPSNTEKVVKPVSVGDTTQILDLPINPYDGGWSEGSTKEFWVGKTESIYESGRASGSVSIHKKQCN